MSRTKGSLNRKTKKITKKNRKRGRPKNPKPTTGYVKIVYPEVKSVKFLGFCSCGALIIEKDLNSAKTYICPSCSKQVLVKKLKKEKENIDRPKSKKEYLEAVLRVNYADSNNAPEVIDNIKIQE